MCAVQVAGMYHSARKEKLFCTCHVVWRQNQPQQVFTQHGSCLLGLLQSCGLVGLYLFLPLLRSGTPHLSEQITHGVCTLRIVINNVGWAWTHFKLKAADAEAPSHALVCDWVPVDFCAMLFCLDWTTCAIYHCCCGAVLDLCWLLNVAFL
jgi:hypothetical protein